MVNGVFRVVLIAYRQTLILLQHQINVASWAKRERRGLLRIRADVCVCVRAFACNPIPRNRAACLSEHPTLLNDNEEARSRAFVPFPGRLLSR